MSGQEVLEVDAGNTRVKWRVLSGEGEVCARGVVAWDGFVESALVNEWSKSSISRIDLASVASREKESRLNAVLDLLKSAPKRVVWSSKQGLGGIQYAYSQMDKLGLDRVLAMVAAHHRSDGGCLVLDAGSALTADFVTGEGVHLGGYIFPGVSMLRASLLSGTSNVYASPEMLGSQSFGVDTEECVENAITVMLSSTLSRLRDAAFEQNINNIFITGGDVGVIRPLLKGRVLMEEELVLDGLSCLRRLEK